MTFALSPRSLENLMGVQPVLVAVVKRAIQITKVDFGVIEVLRTQTRQQELVNSGASQTMNSRHLTGHAVDLMAYINDRASWELNLDDDIADAMKQAATELGTPIKWGGAWTVQDIRKWHGTMASAMNSYMDERRKQGRRPFLDSPHFELP